jgi:hypothetical protein
MDAETRARLERRIQGNCWAVCETDVTVILNAYDAQAARLAAVEEALRWAVETLDGYQAEIPGTEHWMTGWADWLEQQARPALKGAPDA